MASKAIKAQTRTPRKAEAQGKATSRKPKPTLDEIVAQTLSAFGAPDAAVKTVEAAALALEQASASITAWVKVAQQWSKAGRNARDFGDAVNGNANTLGRLLSTGALLDASRKGKGARALTPREAVKCANTHNRGEVAALVSDMLAGGDPLGTRKVRPGAVQPNAGKRAPRKGGTVTTASLSSMLDVLDALIALAPKATEQQAVEGSKRAARLAAILTARAESLAAPVKGTRATMAS